MKGSLPASRRRFSSTHYESYLLRVRREDQSGELACEAMLQSVDGQEKHYFANLASLVDFLQSPGLDLPAGSTFHDDRNGAAT